MQAFLTFLKTLGTKLNDFTQPELLLTIGFSLGLPILFKQVGIDSNVTLASIAMGASFLAHSAYTTGKAP